MPVGTRSWSTSRAAPSGAKGSSSSAATWQTARSVPITASNRPCGALDVPEDRCVRSLRSTSLSTTPDWSSSDDADPHEPRSAAGCRPMTVAPAGPTTRLTFTARSVTGSGTQYSDVRDHGLEVVVAPCTTEDAPPPVPGTTALRLTVRNTGPDWRGVVRADLLGLPLPPQVHPPGPADEPRFSLPAFLVGRNGGDGPTEVVREFPRLRSGEPTRPASPWWMVRADRLSHPVAAAFSGGRVVGLSASPYLVRDDDEVQGWSPGRAGAFEQFCGFTCSLDEGSVGYTLGSENAPWLFVTSALVHERADLDAGAITLRSGASVTVDLQVWDAPAQGPEVFDAVTQAAYERFHTPPRSGSSPRGAVLDLAGAVRDAAWRPEHPGYAGFVFDHPDGSRSDRLLPSLTWTNGLAVATPMLLAGLRLGDEEMRSQALIVIEEVVEKSLNPASGLLLTRSGTVCGGSGAGGSTCSRCGGTRATSSARPSTTCSRPTSSSSAWRGSSGPHGSTSSPGSWSARRPRATVTGSTPTCSPSAPAPGSPTTLSGVRGAWPRPRTTPCSPGARTGPRPCCAARRTTTAASSPGASAQEARSTWRTPPTPRGSSPTSRRSVGCTSSRATTSSSTTCTTVWATSSPSGSGGTHRSRCRRSPTWAGRPAGARSPRSPTRTCTRWGACSSTRCSTTRGTATPRTSSHGSRTPSAGLPDVQLRARGARLRRRRLDVREVLPLRGAAHAELP